MKNGGALVAIGSATETVRQLLDLPIEKVLPESRGRRFFQGGPRGTPSAQVAAGAGLVNLSRSVRSTSLEGGWLLGDVPPAPDGPF